MDPALRTFFASVQSESFWRALAPALHIGSRSDLRPAGVRPDAAVATPAGASVANPDGAGSFARAGYQALDGVVAVETSAALAEGVTALRRQSIHPTFAYVYDETWQVLRALLPRVEAVVGDDCEALADGWAFFVDPRRDRGGWPKHRGWYEDVRDGPGGRVGLVNAWVALTTATERNACMYVVPLPRDPHYPNDLSNLDGLEERALAQPLPAGSALVWNANLAHWGGACDPSFDAPRISLSFTFRRRAGRVAPGVPTVAAELSFAERLDLVAEQFVTYGPRELAAHAREMQWAALVSGMARAAGRGR